MDHNSKIMFTTITGGRIIGNLLHCTCASTKLTRQNLLTAGASSTAWTSSV